ncbi:MULTISPECIES: chaperone NapD [unclassified Methylobacterium]|uniref:chaperone NapD n=1 Tax=unclassified Methylobacterium TaxID=2615210 RepID=UPI000152D0BA|nr:MULTISPECIES: chaperone NapD [Methylobacterium]WFT81266.1 chaperone NapD [Methylobacterium nodulans]
MAHEQASLSRRDLLAGRPAAGRAAGGGHHVSGLVVHARPERLAGVLASLRAMPGLDVHGESPAGKIVATLETSTEDDVVQRLGEIGELPGVLSTALVYHRFD